MELAAAAMSPLLDKLGELLVGELTLERRVREDVISLRTEMEFLHTALREVAKVPFDQLDEQEQVALWGREARELSYDMEDAVDSFIVRFKGNPEPARAGLKSRVQELLNKTARLFHKGKALHQLAGAIGDAQRRAKLLGDLRQRYERLELPVGGTGSGTGVPIDPRVFIVPTRELVGVDGSRDKLINKLSDGPKKHVRTLSIFGFGGLGKTTLARAVYDKVEVQFECGAFVSVSQRPDITRIFKKMLFELDKKKFAHINEAVRDADQLIHQLRGFLQNKRYIIVVDDIWNQRNWKEIKCAIPENDCGSRIITTSRKRSVSQASCSSIDDNIYEMKPLSESDSRRLFNMRIFGHRNVCPPELEQVSQDILKKCGGVPLAINSIASSLLASQKQIKAKDQWYNVLNSIGYGLAQGGDVEGMRKILSYSYYDLPSHLKTCLLYLSIFPEDHDIGRDRLIWRWIAEGFVQHKNNNDNLYELGESYFNELINRSMVHPVGIDIEGRAQSCRVHDMVLDLIRFLSMKENFVMIWGGSSTQPSTLSQTKVRRLSLQNSSAAPGSSTTAMSQVRSFTVFSPAVNSMPSLSQFQVLRVLDLEGCALSEYGDHFKPRHVRRNRFVRSIAMGSLPHGAAYDQVQVAVSTSASAVLQKRLIHVGNLSLLRYLGLRRTYIHELPVEIGKLQFLQTLDIRGANGIQELPKSISRLRKLICLHLDWETKLPKNVLSNLTSLQELTGLRIGHDSAHVVKELGNLTGLTLLTMRWEETDLGEDLVETLGNLPEIQTLDLYVNGGRGDLIRSWVPPPSLRRFLWKGPSSHLSTLPAWLSGSSLPYLTFLDVWVGKVRRDDLQALGALTALRGLRLRATGRIEDHRDMEWITVPVGVFPTVQACSFLRFATVPAMFLSGAMPVVRRLEFSVWAWGFTGGAGLCLDDLSMEHIPSLEEIGVDLWYRRGDGYEVEMVAAALRRTADGHPNHPTLRINYQQEEDQPHRAE
ncbi:unnamed protein product [Urochloa decumbens]|uniref:Uncharacterized protein n=1 Tax=Urochloa decumbens TaxID=240449 RepID=A0ABC8ZMM1_9POAL